MYPVMLYKRLFDNLVKGRLSNETIAKHLKLDLNKDFGESIVKLMDEKSTGKKRNNLDSLITHQLNQQQTHPRL
jgi:hypothetical protein